MIELYFLIISILIVLSILYYTQTTKNGVEKVKAVNAVNAVNAVEAFSTFSLSSCPLTYTALYDSNSNVICCGGDVVINKCMSDNKCTLNGKGTESMPNCADLILKDYETKGITHCPPSMRNYYEDTSTKKKGCSESILNNTLNGPKDTSLPKCTIYNTMEENTNSMNSCYNLKQMEEYHCFGSNCAKSLVQYIANKPVLVAVNFIDNTGIPHVGYTEQSMEVYLDATAPQWKEQGIDLSKNIRVASVAKAVYIDKTMSIDDVQMRL